MPCRGLFTIKQIKETQIKWTNSLFHNGIMLSSAFSATINRANSCKQHLVDTEKIFQPEKRNK